MMNKLAQFVEIIRQDPAVAKVTGFYGGGSSYGSAFVVLKPLSERFVLDIELYRKVLK
jgi:multidrug efflux pump